MRIEHQIHVPVGLEETWKFVWQIERLVTCLPGCTRVEELEALRRYRVQVEDRVGPYKIGFYLNVSVEDSEPKRFIRVRAVGQDTRLTTSQQVELFIRFHEVDREWTTLEIVADVNVVGRIAALGQFVVRRKIQETMRRFASNVRAELERGKMSENETVENRD